MVIPSVFELNSIKDQLSLLAALASHIDFENMKIEELDPTLEQLLNKMDKATKNLKDRYENLENLLKT